MILTVVSFLQQCPRYRFMGEQAETALGTALLEFLRHYGEQLNLNAVGISTRDSGSFFPKLVVGTQRGWANLDREDRLCLEALRHPQP